MLHVNDPVNTGISSELDIEAEWFEPLRPVSSKVFQTGIGGGPVAMLLVELHKGTGFPSEAVSVRGGFRWRSKVETSFVSRRGELCDVERLELLDMPLINPRLFPVIDNLTERGFSRYEIAEIIDAESPELVTLYWQAKHENNQKQEAFATAQRQEHHRVNLQWYEVISHLIYDLTSAHLTLELLDDEDHEIGCIGPLPLKSILASGGKLEQATHTLSFGISNGCQGGGGGLVSWFMQPRTTALDPRRFASVEMRISAQLQFLESRKRIPHRGQNLHHNAGG